MIAKQTSVKELLDQSQTHFDIPYFQRGYVWEEENWSKLFEQLSTQSSSYFIGSIIIKMISGKRDENGKYSCMVIDGQQRITTVSLLLKALLDEAIRTNKNSDNVIKIANLIYLKIDNEKNLISVNDDGSIDFTNVTTKLKPSMNDKDSFEAVMKNKENVLENKKDHRVIRCYRYFKNVITDTARRNLINFFTDDTIKSFVEICLDHIDNEQAIFDTTNSTGVSLTCADIVKNDLFRRIDEGKREKEYMKKWFPIFDDDEDNFKYWNSKDGSGRTNLEHLLLAVAQIEKNSYGELIYNPNRGDTYDKLSDRYKEFFEDIGDSKKLEDFVKKFCKYANVFKEYLTFDETQKYTYGNYIDRFILTIHKLKVSTVLNPYLLKVLFHNADDSGKVFHDKEEYIEERFKKVERLLIRANIVSNCIYRKDDHSRPNTKNFNRAIVTALEKDDINTIYTQEQLNVINNDEKVAEGLRSLRENDTPAIILFLLNLKLTSLPGKTSAASAAEFPFNYSLEHIMPQQFLSTWGLPELFDENGNLKTEEERENYRKDHVYMIGNMTIITQNLNSKIKNNDIQTKMFGDPTRKNKNGSIRKNYQGYIGNCDEKISSDFISSINERNCTWNEEMIEFRTQELTKMVLAEWK